MSKYDMLTDNELSIKCFERFGEKIFPIPAVSGFIREAMIDALENDRMPSEDVWYGSDKLPDGADI